MPSRPPGHCGDEFDKHPQPNTLTGARLVEAAVDAWDAAMLRGDTAALLSPEGRARAALRAQAEAAGLDAEMLASADELLRLGHHGVIAAFLRAMAEVLRGA